MKILIVEDERKVGQFVERALAEQHYTTHLTTSCASARDALAETPFDVIVLDLGLPDGDGLDLLREWRATGFNEPVLILSARDAVSDRIHGLNLGADDYLPKPFSVEELIARIRSLLRRNNTAAPHSVLLEHRGIRLDLLAHAVTHNGTPVELTNREFALLELFLQNVGRVLTRTLISEKIWEASYDMETNLIDVYVRRLRQKFEPSAQEANDTAAHERAEAGFPKTPPLIKTIRGTGYQLG